jgi:hypothetical protein
LLQDIFEFACTWLGYVCTYAPERVVELTKDDCDDQDSGDERHGAQQPAMLSSLKYSTPVGDRQIDVTKVTILY